MTQSISNEQVLSDFQEMLNDCADLILRYSTDKENHFDALKKVTKEVCDVDLQYQKAVTALNKTKSHFNSKDVDCTVEMQSMYKEFLDADKDVSEAKNHTLYKIIQKKSVLDDNDASLLCSGSKQSVLDPISKMPIKVPCRNVKCNHIYDLETIQTYIKSRTNGKAQCPYIGCRNGNILPTDLDCSREVMNNFTMAMYNESDNTQNSIINISL